ncbi:MAG: RibD family protein [Methanobacteriota archaeon]|nr:MAG: RibD family protein [Euryarchaeota archaeon]
MDTIFSILDLETEEIDGLVYYVNMACSFDAIVAKQGHPIEISDEEDWSIVHKLRSQSVAVLVGSTTILADDPSLLVKSKYVPNAHHPLRIVLDRRGRLTGREKVFKNQDKSRTLWFTSKRLRLTKEPKYHIVKVRENIETEELIQLIAQTLQQDYNIKEGFIMVEGGPHVVKSFLEAGVVKRFRLYRSNSIEESGVPIFSLRPRVTLVPHQARVMKSGIEELYEIKI